MDREGLTSYLSPILGQYGIKNIDFISTFVEEFNKKTNNYLASQLNSEKIEEKGLVDFELTIPVKLKAYKAGKFTITIKYPNLTFIQREYIKKKKKLFKLLRHAGTGVTFAKAFVNSKKLLQLVLFHKLNASSLDNSTLLEDELNLIKMKANEILSSSYSKRIYLTLRQRFKYKSF